MASKEKEKELWVSFALAAMRGYERPDELEELSDVVDDMIAVAAEFADGMLDELDTRYAAGRGDGRRRKAVPGRFARLSGERRRDEDDEDDE